MLYFGAGVLSVVVLSPVVRSAVVLSPVVRSAVVLRDVLYCCCTQCPCT